MIVLSGDLGSKGQHDADAPVADRAKAGHRCAMALPVETGREWALLERATRCRRVVGGLGLLEGRGEPFAEVVIGQHQDIVAGPQRGVPAGR